MTSQSKAVRPQPASQSVIESPATALLSLNKQFARTRAPATRYFHRMDIQYFIPFPFPFPILLLLLILVLIYSSSGERVLWGKAQRTSCYYYFLLNLLLLLLLTR